MSGDLVIDPVKNINSMVSVNQRITFTLIAGAAGNTEVDMGSMV